MLELPVSATPLPDTPPPAFTLLNILTAESLLMRALVALNVNVGALLALLGEIGKVGKMGKFKLVSPKNTDLRSNTSRFIFYD
jgi:hypothetical protein